MALLLCLGLCLAAPALQAQNGDPLLQFNAERLQINRTGMWVLGGWAVGNIAFSGWRRFQTEGRRKAFHDMNIMWNTVNLGIAAFNILGAQGDGTSLSLAESLREEQFIEKFLLLNVGLDVGYVMTGFFLREKSKTASAKWQTRFGGWGDSLLLQGGFLFVFDLSLYFLLHQNSESKLMPLIEGLSVGPQGLGLSLSF